MKVTRATKATTRACKKNDYCNGCYKGSFSGSKEGRVQGLGFSDLGFQAFGSPGFRNVCLEALGVWA